MATKPRVNVVGGYFMGEDISLFDAGVFNLASGVASVKDISKSKIKKLGKSVFLAEFHRVWTLNADCFLRQCTKQPKMVSRLSLIYVLPPLTDGAAGFLINKLAGSNTSVYACTVNKDYHEIQAKDAEVLPHSFLASSGTAMLSDRISHFFDLQGPGLGLSEKYIADPTNGGHIVVACINSPKSVTFSRNLEALDELAAKLEEGGIFARKLKISMAYHSHHTAPMAQEYADRLRAILPQTTNKSWTGELFAYPVTGEVITSTEVFSPHELPSTPVNGANWSYIHLAKLPAPSWLKDHQID
ncbi:hypothetical protein MaudCBS49596_004566 [Microsporum audouinii]